jgi:hypothetical protein
VSVPVWCGELAAAFWTAAGRPPVPRDLESAVTWRPDLDLHDLPGLSVGAVNGWFARRGVRLPLAEPDRRLRACVVAVAGRGYVFRDADDPADERRFSLAHEVGHFLRDYWHPRRTAVRRVGPGVAAVLDGERPPTADERLAAVFRNVAVRPFAHLLRRDDAGRPLTPDEAEAEAAADRLAFELLAPAESLEAEPDRAAVVRRLVAEFGLPPGPAGRYADILRPPPGPSFARRFISEK